MKPVCFSILKLHENGLKKDLYHKSMTALQSTDSSLPFSPTRISLSDVTSMFYVLCGGICLAWLALAAEKITTRLASSGSKQSVTPLKEIRYPSTARRRRYAITI